MWPPLLQLLPGAEKRRVVQVWTRVSIQNLPRLPSLTFQTDVFFAFYHKHPPTPVPCDEICHALSTSIKKIHYRVNTWRCPMLFWCRASVADAGSALKQHRVKCYVSWGACVSRLGLCLGIFPSAFPQVMFNGSGLLSGLKETRSGRFPQCRRRRHLVNFIPSPTVQAPYILWNLVIHKGPAKQNNVLKSTEFKEALCFVLRSTNLFGHEKSLI